jgi:hypothetical protein
VAQFIELLVLGGQAKVNNNNITKISMDEFSQIEDLTDWQSVKKKTDEEIQKNANDDPDCQPTSDDFWNDAKVVKLNTYRASK